MAATLGTASGMSLKESLIVSAVWGDQRDPSYAPSTAYSSSAIGRFTAGQLAAPRRHAAGSMTATGVVSGALEPRIRRGTTSPQRPARNSSSAEARTRGTLRAAILRRSHAAYRSIE